MTIAFANHPIVYDVCAVSDDGVLLAVGSVGLRSFSLSRNEVSTRPPADIRDVYRVAFDSATGTLLLLVRPPDAATCSEKWVLMTKRRNASEWIEVAHYNVKISPASDRDIVVCSTRLIYVETGSEKVTGFCVMEVHTLYGWGYADSLYNGLACAVTESNTAFAYALKSEVRLWRTIPNISWEPPSLLPASSCFTDTRKCSSLAGTATLERTTSYCGMSREVDFVKDEKTFNFVSQ